MSAAESANVDAQSRHDNDSDDREKPDVAAAFALLRLINRNDAVSAYAMVAQWSPDETVAALVEACLGVLRIEVTDDAGLTGAEVTERIDQRLGSAARRYREVLRDTAALA